MIFILQTLLTPEERSSPLSSLLFSWLDPLVWAGFRAPLDIDQIPRVRPDLAAGHIGAEFNRHFVPTTGNEKGIEGAENKGNEKDDLEMVDIVKMANERDGVAVAVEDGKEKAVKGQNVLVPLLKAFGRKFAESVALKVSLMDLLVLII